MRVLHEKIDYVAFPSRDLNATKQFFQQAFGWTFEDYGPDYLAFSNSGIDGGFSDPNWPHVPTMVARC